MSDQRKIAAWIQLAPTRFDSLKGAMGSRRDTMRFHGPNLLEDRYDIGTVEERLGPKDALTTIIYTHVLNRGSPRGQESRRTL